VPWKAYLITLPGDEAKADFSLAQLRGLGLEVEVVHGINSTQARPVRGGRGRVRVGYSPIACAQAMGLEVEVVHGINSTQARPVHGGRGRVRVGYSPIACAQAMGLEVEVVHSINSTQASLPHL